ncbi:NAD(P)-dependent oxidoreductase [Paenibacillus sp.]|uniref:NAD(P)-dependent oxidoreductase n=1 Tax=Paenibacillus sp. TaxID=58172 RepID=UPI002D56B510|nr:NAD(P)-dependent oxidoreductase [Paenibacillus sp.]HZG85496.1 NAD(P)-dependent oxidoreductase [Paenibacillus sp.]
MNECTPERTTIGFIGTGVMGTSMAGHLLSAGYRLRVYTRTKAKAEPLLAKGAVWCDTPAELAAESDAVVSIVGYPSDVERLYLAEDGIVANGKPGALLIDMTTSSPSLARRIHAAAAGRGMQALDAPVSGGDVGAREARLSIMVGGEPEAFAAARPLFEKMGKTVVRQGGPGAGQHTKMCNQIAIASGMLGVCEALAYAERAGLDPSAVLSSIETGAAGSWSLSNLGPRIIAGNFEPGFYVKHFVKDMKIALDAAEEMQLDLPGLALARTLYERLIDMGCADQGTQALFKYYKS